MGLPLREILKDDWDGVRRNFDKIKTHLLGPKAIITLADVTLTNLTASQLLQTDANKKLTSISDLSAWILQGSANQVRVNDEGDGTVTLSLPQDYDTAATPTLAQLTLSKTSTLAAGLNVLRVTGLQTDGTAMTGTLRGAYIDISNGSTAAAGTIRGMELKARTEASGDTGNDVTVLEGLSISADSKGHSVTTMRAAEFILDGSTGGTITEAVGLRIANNLQANKATTSYGLQIYRDSFDYTADIQLSNGGLIGSNSISLKSNSVSFQPATDSTTFFQVLDADGGTPILNIDSTNERVGFHTVNPCRIVHIYDDSATPRIYLEGTVGSYPGFEFGFDATAIRRAIIRASSTGTYGTELQFFVRKDLPGGGIIQRMTLTSLGFVGFGESAPETLTEWKHGQPYLTLHNSSHGDSDGGRESRIIFKGEQSGGEETTLARIEASHDGSADDEKGKLVISINDGNDGDSPTQALEIGSDLLATFAGSVFPASIELGHASDTTITRVSAGVIAVEGTAVMLVGDAPTAHAILDGSVHNDSVADAVTRGSIIYGNTTPKWDELVIGVANTFLGSDGTDLSYRTAAQVLASLSGEAAATFSFNSQNLTAVGGITIADGGIIRCAGAPVLTFNDTSNLLAITGCKVGFATSTPYRTIHLAGPSSAGVGKIRYSHDSYLNSYYWDVGRENLSTGDFEFTYGDIEAAETLVMALQVDGKVGVGVLPKTKFTIEGALTLKEQASADGDTAAYMQVWAKNTVPNELWCTDDAGTDFPLSGFSPAAMAGEDDSNGSCTFPNGLIMKWGKTTRTGIDTTVTFAAAFPNACFQAIGSLGTSTDITWNAQLYSIAAASFIVTTPDAGMTPIRWFAIGR